MRMVISSLRPEWHHTLSKRPDCFRHVRINFTITIYICHELYLVNQLIDRDVLQTVHLAFPNVRFLFRHITSILPRVCRCSVTATDILKWQWNYLIRMRVTLVVESRFLEASWCVINLCCWEMEWERNIEVNSTDCHHIVNTLFLFYLESISNGICSYIYMFTYLLKILESISFGCLNDAQYFVIRHM